MLDTDKFRPGVVIIVCNTKGEVLWAKRHNREAWQFPQGGILDNEPLKDALYRELEEETGLTQSHVQILGETRDWLIYEWPNNIRSKHFDPQRIGQQQKWFLVRLIAEDTAIRLDHTSSPEFEKWRWVDYWYPLNHIVDFKKEAYQQALHELVIYR